MLMIQNRTRSEISPYQEADSSSFTQTANIILTVLLCVLVLTAAIGNGILIFVVVHSKEQRHQSDFFIVSLASADFLMCVIVFPISMTYQLEGSWRFGKTACKLWIVLDVAFSAVAIYTMSAICMNVCFHVRRSFVAIYEFAQRRTHEVNAMIWVFAFLIATIPLIFDYELTDLGNDYAVCMFNEPPAHAVTVSAIVFFIPTTWSFFLYAELMTTYVNVMKLKRSRIDPEDMTVEQRGLFTVSPHINAILTMGIKLTIYLLCWMPYFVVKVVHAFCQTCEHPVANKVAVWLPYVSSWVSPFVYGMLNRRVHDRMKELCPRICWALSTKISPPNDNPSWQNLEQNEPTPTVQNTGSPSKKSSCNKSSEKDSKFENGTTTSNMPLELKGFPANEVPENLLEPPRNTFEGESKEGYTKHLWKQLATQNMTHKEPYNVYYFCKGDVAKDLSEERDAKGLAYNAFQGPTDRQNAGKIHDEIWHTKQHDVGYHNIQTQYQSYASSSHQSTHKLIENPLGQAEEGAVDQTAVKTMKPRNRRRSFGIGGSTCPATDAVFQARDLHTLAVKQKTAARFSESWMKRFTRQESLKSLNKGLVLPLAVGKPLKLRENGILNFLEPESEDVHEASEKTIPQRRESSVDLSIYSRHTFWTDIDDKSSTFEDFHNDRSLIRPSTLNSTQKTSSSFLSEMNTGKKKKSLRQRSCKQGSDTLQNASRPAERVFDEEAGWGRGHGDLIVRFQDEADFCVNDHPSEGRTLQSSEDENTSDGNTEAEDSFWGTMTVRPRRQKRRRLLAMAKLRSKNRLDLRESAYSSASDSSILSIGSRPQGLLAFMLLGTDLSASVSNNMVPTSPLIDLKAELFRKQEEFRQLKLQNNADFVKGRKVEKHGKPDIWSKKNAGVSQRSEKDIQQTEEEEDILEKSRRALEAKSKIYDQIASTSDIPEDDGSEGYLVDFQKKTLDRIVEERRKEPESYTQEIDADLSNRDLGRVSDEDVSGELPPLSFEPDEEWVDYVDTFGRSRRCMKKDLPYLGKQERILGKGNSHEGLKLKADAPTLLSADMRRELLRQKWEQEMEQTQNGPVHYSNVQFDEIRTHGVGYYQFSKDSTLREEQMTSLNKLREQTLEGRLRSERIKEKRKAALDARLAKVKQRRKMKDGSLPEESSMDEKADAATATEDKTKLKLDPEPLVRDDSWRLTAPVREWDKGKEKMPQWSEKRYMEDRRNERQGEFAPPQFYYDSQSKTSLSAPHPIKRIGDQRSTANLGDKKAMSSVINDERSTMPMLSQKRSSATSEVDGIIAKDLSVHDSTNLDLSAIPLPLKDFTNSLSDVESVSSRNAPLMQDRFSDMSQSLPCQVAESNTATCHMQSPSLGSPVCNFSVPPPGWNLTHPPVGGGTPVPSHTTDLPIAEVFETHSSFSVATSNFLYPSQQGVLTPQSQQQHRQFHHESGSNHTISTQPLLTRSISCKAGIVDKRFMQNKEASEADLLGFNFSESEDALAQVKPVSYKPGLFSATFDVSSECERNANKSINYAEGVHVAESNPVKGETVSLPESSSKGQKPATVQTESVIFGVPEFLQPASGVEAKAYQPGSFMAAKVAAAERAEEAYEAARQKTSYCSEPVLYSKPSSTTCDKTDDGK